MSAEYFCKDCKEKHFNPVTESHLCRLFPFWAFIPDIETHFCTHGRERMKEAALWAKAQASNQIKEPE